ncbi:hypothetical protein CYMTET_19948, partial [Cymbomonas tetramitiformis]
EVDSAERLKLNASPKWSVPIELIEWQPSFTQKGALGISGGAWQPDWAMTESSKCAYLIARLVALGIPAATSSAGPHREHHRGWDASRPSAARSFPGAAPKRAKVIIFSQFWMHLQLVKARLQLAGIRHVVFHSASPQSEKAAVLRAFQGKCAIEDSVQVLLMDSAGSVGLDLSFVQHVFLMEPIADRSLEEQRAALMSPLSHNEAM